MTTSCSFQRPKESVHVEAAVCARFDLLYEHPGRSIFRKIEMAEGGDPINHGDGKIRSAFLILWPDAV